MTVTQAPKAAALISKINHASTLLREAKQELDHLVEELGFSDPTELLITYKLCYSAHKELDAERKSLNKSVDGLNKGKIPEMFESLGTDKMQIPAVSTSFYPLVKYTASIVDDEELGKAPAYDWLKEQGLGELITQTVNAGTLASAMKELVVDHGIDPPEHLIKVNNYKTTGMSAYKPKD